MPSYKGNVGNLLQHWVFCEIIEACRGHVEQLALVDAYSMAPFANQRTAKRADCFDRVRDRLPGQRSAYECAWHEILQGRPADSGYPNSAAFLTNLWKAPYSLLLCEADSTTAGELEAWLESISRAPNCRGDEIYEGDWRARFKKGISPAGDLVFFSFDPYMFDRHTVKEARLGNMYPEDLALLVSTVRSMRHGVIVQLSTFNANNVNPQGKVSAAIASEFEKCGFKIIANVRANGNMMSVVLTRNVDWDDSLRALPDRFSLWLGPCRRNARKRKARE
jgi:hypothetical protein